MSCNNQRNSESNRLLLRKVTANISDKMLIHHNEVVKKIGRESSNVKFRKVPATKVLSIFHKSAYELLGEAYAYIVKYAKGNKYGGMEPYGS